MKIQVEIKSVYGEEKCYPVGETAETFARLTGNKTLTKAALREIASLGYEIEVVKVGSFNTAILYTMQISPVRVAQ